VVAAAVLDQIRELRRGRHAHNSFCHVSDGHQRRSGTKLDHRVEQPGGERNADDI
jgi:hypothetical protein